VTHQEKEFPAVSGLTINFKGIDFKKAENRLDLEVKMPHGSAKKLNSIAFVKDKDFAEKLKGLVTRVVFDSELEKLSKKDIQEIAENLMF